MVEWAWLSGAGGFVLGLTGGYFWGVSRSADKRVKELESELSEAQQEADSYREQVTEHFQGTADLVNDLTEKYRAVYRHLAEGARDLCGNEKLALTAVRDERLLQTGDTQAANENVADSPDEAIAEVQQPIHINTPGKVDAAVASNVAAEPDTMDAEIPPAPQEPPAVIETDDSSMEPVRRDATVH